MEGLRWAGCEQQRRDSENNKSFLVLFFKKERLPYFI
jgi:hypothetical protein